MRSYYSLWLATVCAPNFLLPVYHAEKNVTAEIDSDRGLTPESPFIPRFYAWVQERFPFSQGILFLVLYVAALFTGQAMTNLKPLKFKFADVVGFLAVWGFFLMLRIFDEHKDFELDLENYPHRVLQSNLISLTHLKIACGFAISLQLGVSIWFDQGIGLITFSWLAVMLWSALMAKEFFIGDWLNKRLFLYAFSHMLVMPLAVVWMAEMGASGRWPGPPIAVLGLIAFCSGFAFELTRKNRAPEEERLSVDSYSRHFGVKGAAAMIAIFLLTAAAGQFWLLGNLLDGRFHKGWMAGLVFVLLPAFFTLTRFVTHPTISGRKHNEGSLALAMLGGYVILIAALISDRGVQF